jgi:uncharacterized protein (DUF2267 family)
MKNDILYKHVNKAYEWLRDIDSRLGYNSLKHALAFLRVVLHQLRDNLPLNESIHFSAQLPLVIKGLYFENWNPNIIPIKDKTIEEFLITIEEALSLQDILEVEIENGIAAVLETLACKIDFHEIKKIYHSLPKGMRKLFNELKFI